MPPKVMLIIKQLKINPVGMAFSPITICILGTHMNTNEYTPPSKNDCDRPRHLGTGLQENCSYTGAAVYAYVRWFLSSCLN